MLIAILVLIVAFTVFWLVFFKLKLLRLTPAWGFVFSLFAVHVLLVFVIGLRFVTPASTNATVVQHTIQLIPRLPDPTLVTAVLVEDNVDVKKDQPLFQFDRRPYEYKVKQIEAQLAAAKQNVKVLKADLDVATFKAIRTKLTLDYDLNMKSRYDQLAKVQAVKEDDVVQWRTRVNEAQAARDEALAELERQHLGRQHRGATPASAILPRQYDAQSSR
jgi:multidrug resistance efflux pump